MGIVLSFLTGLFFVLGIMLSSKYKNKEALSLFSYALASIVLLNLIVFDIFPEAKENFSFYSAIALLLGIFLLKILDLLVPHHHHDHKEFLDNKKEHHLHQEHISIITIMALMLHNILECMALVNVCITDLKAGIFMFLGIALHNIPLGLSMNFDKHKKLYIILLISSGLLGGILANVITLSLALENYVLCFTLGMLIYLLVFELLEEVYKNVFKKETIIGLLIGLLFVIIGALI